MTTQIIFRAAGELAKFHVVSVDEALQLIAWSREHYPNDWEIVAGAIAEFTNLGISVEDLLQFNRKVFPHLCLVYGVWLPEKLNDA